MIPEVIVIKKVDVSKCPILNDYVVTAAWNLEQHAMIIEKMWNNNNKHITWKM
jgi:hypothetical protein